MPAGKIITIIGFSLIFLYIIIQILKFYGVSSDEYGTYIGFYLFLLLSILILPNSFASLKI
jgi:hypothetical protein